MTLVIGRAGLESESESESEELDDESVAMIGTALRIGGESCPSSSVIVEESDKVSTLVIGRGAAVGEMSSFTEFVGRGEPHELISLD